MYKIDASQGMRWSRFEPATYGLMDQWLISELKSLALMTLGKKGLLWCLPTQWNSLCPGK